MLIGLLFILLRLADSENGKLAEKPASRQARQSSESLFTNLSKTIGKHGNATEINKILKIITQEPTNVTSWWRSASMEGLAETIGPDQRGGATRDRLDALRRFFAEHVDPNIS